MSMFAGGREWLTRRLSELSGSAVELILGGKKGAEGELRRKRGHDSLGSSSKVQQRRRPRSQRAGIKGTPGRSQSQSQDASMPMRPHHRLPPKHHVCRARILCGCGVRCLAAPASADGERRLC